MAKAYRNMTIKEHDEFRDNAKCNWLKCAGGMGLVGRGQCDFNGEWNRADCPKFITDEDYEKKQGRCNEKED